MTAVLGEPVLDDEWDDAPPPLPRGAEVAPGYVVHDHLRRGEDFDVYEAWSTARYSRCVVKTPRPDRADEARIRRSLVREGRLLLASCHPHLVRAYELHAPRGGVPALVLETLRRATSTTAGTCTSTSNRATSWSAAASPG